jgi:adenine specific DNA methylase Mod
MVRHFLAHQALHRKDEARTHLDRQGHPSPAGAAHPPRRPGPQPPRDAPGTDRDLFDNRLVFGDNLLALKALEQEFAGKVKCVFIDPPYNTGSAFTHYDDGVEHSIWLGLMRDRLEILRRLLADRRFAVDHDRRQRSSYLRFLCDEVFGRSSFVAQNVWQKRYSRDNRLCDW